MLHVLLPLQLGRRPFGAAWNKWANPRGLPVLTLQESYLGRWASGGGSGMLWQQRSRAATDL